MCKFTWFVQKSITQFHTNLQPQLFLLPSFITISTEAETLFSLQMINLDFVKSELTRKLKFVPLWLVMHDYLKYLQTISDARSHKSPAMFSSVVQEWN